MDGTSTTRRVGGQEVVGVTQQGADRAARIGLALLIALNIVDLLFTRRFLAYGLGEGNPLMATAVRSWQAGAVKAVVLGLLAISFAARPTTAIRLTLVWAAVGFYLLAAYVNASALHQAMALGR